MSNQRFKPWARRESEAGSVQPAKQDTSGDDGEQTPAEAPADSSIVQRVFAATGDADTAPDVPAEAAPADLSEVGAEVGTVLKTAQEAADRIRSAAREEAGRIREEAKAEVAAAVEEAQRLAESDRADGERVRKEAAASAKQMRADAEREAEQIRERAQQRLDQADREVEEKLRRAEEGARQRRDALAAESARYHERLEKMLGVFHGMSSQLEELLATPTSEDAAASEEPADKTLEEALQPDADTARRG
jgi:vacuolar-type H+-ATPase subunit E/Vma4